MFHSDKEPHFTHIVSPVSSNAENSFGEWQHKLDNYNDKEIENLYVEDTQHKYDHNLLTFINKKKRQHNSISIPSQNPSYSQQQIKQHNYEDLVIGNYDHIEIIDGQMAINLNVSHRNEEENSGYIMNKNLEIEYKGDDKGEGCFLTREVEIDYQGKKKMAMKSFIGGIQDGEFYYIEKEGVVLDDIKSNERKERKECVNEEICDGIIEDVDLLEEQMKWKEGNVSWEEGNEMNDDEKRVGNEMESEVVLLESMLKWKEKENSVAGSLSLCLLEEQMKWDGNWEEEEEEEEEKRKSENESEIKGNNSVEVNEESKNKEEEINIISKDINSQEHKEEGNDENSNGNQYEEMSENIVNKDNEPAEENSPNEQKEENINEQNVNEDNN